MDDLFTLASLGTFTGAVMAVVVIVNTIRHVFNWGPRWFGLALSILVSFVAFYITVYIGEGPGVKTPGLLKYFIILLNGCLIYTSAFGVQNTVIARTSPVGTPAGAGFRQGAEAPERARLSADSPW
ncbi:MAG: hypothetical protein PVJ01_03305 [Pseudomonadota bacterium]|jgi:hypothetical protein